MKLTKLERHTAYIIMLYEFENKTEYEGRFYTGYYIGRIYRVGFCDVLFHLWEGYIEISDLIELYKKKPSIEPLGAYWFTACMEGWQKRIDLLKECINETA
jgi:hypothetical protein